MIHLYKDLWNRNQCLFDKGLQNNHEDRHIQTCLSDSAEEDKNECKH